MKVKNNYIILIITIILLVIISIINSSNPRKDMIELKIEEVDLSKVADGTYIGNCDMKIVTAVVKVKVENNKIVSIEIIEHKHGPKKGAESIKDKIIEKQSLNVDAISGATGSSKVIRKAVELALKKGIK